MQTHVFLGMYVRGWYMAGKKGRTRVKMPSSIPKTAALKTSAVMNVDVDALVAFDALVEDLRRGQHAHTAACGRGTHMRGR